MGRFVVDSWSWIEYFSGSPVGKKVHELTLDENMQLFTATINEYEVFVKLMRIKNADYAREALNFIEANSNIEPLSRELIELAAIFKVRHGLAMADSIAAAVAEKYGAVVLSGDPDFDKAKDRIKVQHPSKL